MGLGPGQGLMRLVKLLQLFEFLGGGAPDGFGQLAPYASGRQSRLGRYRPASIAGAAGVGGLGACDRRR